MTKDQWQECMWDLAPSLPERPTCVPALERAAPRLRGGPSMSRPRARRGQLPDAALSPRSSAETGMLLVATLRYSIQKLNGPVKAQCVFLFLYFYFCDII